MLEVFLSDIHFPFEDRASWQLTLDVIKDIKPDMVFLGGDILDCYAVSQYDREPDRKLTLQQDLDYAFEELSRLRKACPKNTKILYLEGNHETRLTRYLQSKAEELSVLNAIKLPELLKLDKLKIKWIPNGSRTKIGKLWHLHGNEIAGGGANIAKAKFDRLGTNIIFGHHHKMQSFIKRNYEGEVCRPTARLCSLYRLGSWVLCYRV